MLSNWGSREGKFLKAENNREPEQPARSPSLISCSLTAQMVSSLPDASPFYLAKEQSICFVKILENLLQNLSIWG